MAFNFCDENGKPYQTIILAGENGSGKSTLLNAIYNFFHSPQPQLPTNERDTFEFELTERESTFLANVMSSNYPSSDRSSKNQLTVTINHSLRGWGALEVTVTGVNKNSFAVGGGFLHQGDGKGLLKNIFSDVDVNYQAQQVTSTTTLDVDAITPVARSTASLGKEIIQLLVDIDSLDNGDLADWVRSNPNANVADRPQNTRMSRFTRAFESMFPSKRLKRVVHNNNSKDVIFEEFGRDISINDLSSGEKQIVFRGSFLLKNKLSSEGAIILIDEPEISLHPSWQLKILDFYKNLFKNDEGIQTSQLFVTTHSPFVIHNDTRSNDKVIVLKKDLDGKIFIPQDAEFYSWTREKVIEEAFDLSSVLHLVRESPKHLVVTEGKTDWKHLKKALAELKQFSSIKDKFEFLEFDDKVNMGDDQLLQLCQSISKLSNPRKIIAIFDRDESKTIKKVSEDNGDAVMSWGNNVYSFVLPIPPDRISTPNICIEHYYTDDEIMIEDKGGKRLYLGNEFSEHGIHNDLSKVCGLLNKCGKDSIKIIDNGVYFITRQEENIALPKSKFAQNIFDEVNGFNNVNFKNFALIFQIIEKLIEVT